MGGREKSARGKSVLRTLEFAEIAMKLTGRG